MKKILYIIGFICLFFTACDKKEGDNEQSQSINKYRVKRIFGTETGKGEVQYLFSYNNKNTLDSVWICDVNSNIEKRDTIGSMQFNSRDGYTNSYIYNYVLRIDADSVAKIKALYPNTYVDTLKRRRASITTYYKSTKEEYPIRNEKHTTYIPNPNPGIGEDFEYKYLTKQKQDYKYEYDENGKIVVTRMFTNTYDLEGDNSNFKITIHKIEYNYSGNNIVSANYYKSRYETEDNKDSWEKTNTYEYTYNGKTLSAVIGDNFKLVRNGNTISVTEDSRTIDYLLNDEGYLVKITYSDGNSINIEYESGHGNFADMHMPISKRLLGIPYIK